MRAWRQRANRRKQESAASYVDESFYHFVYPDVPRGPGAALSHFLNYGWREGRDPSPAFSTSKYSALYSDLLRPGLNPLIHYIENKDNHNLSLSESEHAAVYRSARCIYSDFDIGHYLSTNTDVAEAGVNPVMHFARIGWREGRNPAPWFQTSFYLQENPDVTALGTNPFEHYVLFGREEGRHAAYPFLDHPTYSSATCKNAAIILEEISPYLFRMETSAGLAVSVHTKLKAAYKHLLEVSDAFDSEYYASMYLSGCGPLDPLNHYLNIGSNAGLRPCPYFDGALYLSLYPEIRRHGIDPYIHYLFFGWRDGRSVGPLFDTNHYYQAYPRLKGSLICPLLHSVILHRHDDERLPPSGSRPVFSVRSEANGITGERRSRGCIILVTHDLEVGGAQTLIRSLAKWLIERTDYSVKFISCNGGVNAAAFQELAPVFDISGYQRSVGEETARQLFARFVPSDTACVIVNSVASAPVFSYLSSSVPVISYIHELKRVIDLFDGHIELIRERSAAVMCGSSVVRSLLVKDYGFNEDRCETVYDFIDPSIPNALISESQPELRKRLGLPVDDVLIVGCGVANWRKAPLLFVEVAQRVIDLVKDVVFVWIGDGPQLEECLELVAQKKLQKSIRFIGQSAGAESIISAADVFLLTSIEDPFPLVCLYAAYASIPLVCFQDAGGMQEFTSRGAGIAVSHGKTDEMANAVIHYINSPEARRISGAIGRDQVQKRHVTERVAPSILATLQSAAGHDPLVTIIVPNFNYRRFLPERLDSIFLQKFQDFEVLILDDASTDNSVEFIKEYVEGIARVELVLRTSNSGSPFKQWMAGLQRSVGHLVWIAEADDYCDLDFLWEITRPFSDRNVRLCFGRSTPVDSQGTRLGDYEELYLDRICNRRWSASYKASDFDEVCASLAIANSIPNASSVVFRNFVVDAEWADALSRMKMCGDWLFYIRAIMGGELSFVRSANNYHRRHGATVTASVEGSKLYFEEVALIRKFVARAYQLPDSVKARAREYSENDIERFDLVEGEANRVLSSLSFSGDDRESCPAVMIVTSDFAPGGGQLFAIRLANHLSATGSRCILVSAGYAAAHPAVTKMIDSNVAYYDRSTQDFDICELFLRFGITVIHSSIWWGDKLVAEALSRSPSAVPWVVTMHGCYETLLEHQSLDPDFHRVLAFMRSRVSNWVVTAEKHFSVMDKLSIGGNVVKIDNGAPDLMPRQISKRDLGLRPEALTLLLASRAIPSKGWYEAIEATQQLNRAGISVDLMLIGEGQVSDDLKASGVPEYVRLFGQVANLIDYVEIADIGLLPSYFVGESMPLVLIDFFSRAKPVIASRIGDIPDMVGSGGDAAGILLEIAQGVVAPSSIYHAVHALLDNSMRIKMGRRAREQYERRFSLISMVRRYRTLYKEPPKTEVARGI